MNTHSATDIEQLLSKVTQELRAIRTSRDRYARSLSPNFSCFNYIDADELMLSRIVADLLNPKGHHAQGRAFLDLFWSFLERRDILHEDWISGWSKATTIQVETEVQTQKGRRMDIYCSTGKGHASYGLCIENKPYAADQKDQLLDYAKELAYRHESRWHLLYLSGFADTPTTWSIDKTNRNEYMEKQQFSTLKYVDLVDWIKSCIAESENERVSLFLKEFINFIQKKFAGVRDMNTLSTIKEQIKKPEYISAAFEIYKSLDFIKKDLMQSLKKQLEEDCQSRNWVLGKADSPNWILEEGFNANFRYEGLTIRYSPNQTKFAFRIEFLATNYNNFQIGVVCLKKTSNPERDGEYQDLYGEIQAALKAQLHSNSIDSSPMWPIRFKPENSNWQNNAEPWQMIIENKMSEHIIRYAQDIHNILKNENLLEKM